MNDMVEASALGSGSVGIYQRAFGADADTACRNDHREDVRRAFACAFPQVSPPAAPTPYVEPSPTPRVTAAATPSTSSGANAQRIRTLRTTVSNEFALTILPAVQSAAQFASGGDWRRSGNYMELAAGGCDLAQDAVAEIARLSPESVWDTVNSHLGRACRGYWDTANALHRGNIDAAARSLDNATTALQRATALVPLF